MKGFTWAIAPALTSLGYLLILLVSIFPFWVRLVNEESQEVFFSGLFENCFHIKCWKPRPLPGTGEMEAGMGAWETGPAWALGAQVGAARTELNSPLPSPH